MPITAPHTISDAERSSIDVAFVPVSDDETELRALHQESSDTLLNQRGAPARPLNGETMSVTNYVRNKLSVVLPVYNQEHTIDATLDYLLEQVGVPPERILAASCSTDGSDDLIRARGVPLIRQQDTLENLLDTDRFLEITRANSMAELRGKGLTMFTAHAHNVLSGRFPEDSFTIQIDTDISNIGTQPGQWDPATYFAKYLSEDASVDAVKAAKNGRNNQPMHIFFNTLGAIDPQLGRHYQRVNMDRWILTGEYGWKSEYTDRLRWATGYAVETVLAMSQTDLEMRRRQIAMPEPRIDGQNLLTKETVMYSDIQRTAMEIVLSGRKFNDLPLSEIARINQRRAEQSGDTMWICHERDANPGPDALPNEPVQVQQSRLLPDIQTLIREKIIQA